MLALAPKPKSSPAPDARPAPPRAPADRHASDYSRTLAYRAVPRPVQAKRGASPRAGGDAPHAAGPATMPGPLRAHMEGALGADLSGVRLHAGSPRARALGAKAFAQGSEVHVAPGYWQPQTPAGRELIGHELAHVVQQRAGRVSATSAVGGAAMNDDAGLEREADTFGARAAGGFGAGSIAAPSASPVTAGAMGAPGAASAVAAGAMGAQAGASPSPASPADGVVQRRPDDDLHGPLLDEFSADTGIPRDQANAHSPGYNAWILVHPLQPLPIEQLLDRLAAMEADGTLASVAAGAGALPLVSYRRERTAIQVVRQMRAPGGGGAAAANATIAASGVSAADQATMGHFVRLPFTRGADQRKGAPMAPAATGVPNADLQKEIGFELEPSSRPKPPPPGSPPPARIPWDGATGAPDEAKNRADMQAELFKAYDAYLKFFKKRVADKLKPGASRVPFTAPAAAAGAANPPTGAVDIANQARDVLEAKYGVSMDAASATPAQAFSRGKRVDSPAGDQNIFDPYDPAQRSTLRGQPVADLSQGVAWWLFQNDVPDAAGAKGSRTFATEILEAHHWSTQDPGAVAFRTEVAKNYVANDPGNPKALLDYRLAQWNERGERGITLLSAFDPGKDAGLAERRQRWQIFKTGVHESLHLRTHPAFTKAAQGRGTMVEGFTEMFTVDTLNDPATGVLPRVRAGSMEGLRKTVEGTLATATPDAAVITDATTGTQYKEHRAAAERIRDGGTPVAKGPTHGGIGETGVRAAYFQGHVEYLGLDPSGAQLAGAPPAGVQRQIHIPAGIASVDDLAWRSGVPKAELLSANPGLATPFPPTAVLPGCREHVVVMSRAKHPVSGVAANEPETRANIAAQHGVSEADLARANPDIALDAATSGWPALTEGQKILIPRH